MAVFSRQLSAAWPRALAAGRNVRVLGEEQRLVAALLDEASNGPRAERVVCGEVADSELDRASLMVDGGTERFAVERVGDGTEIHSWNALATLL